MTWYVYSHEALPNPKYMGKPGYTPDNDYIRYNGVCLPALPEKTWVELPDYFTVKRFESWRDRQGRTEEIRVDKFKNVVERLDDGRFHKRGVAIVDHKPSDYDQHVIEKECAARNLEFRKGIVEQFEENLRNRQITGVGRSKPTPYEDECFDVLDIPKPYSVEAMKAQRQPGREAAKEFGKEIVKAFQKLQEESARAAAK